ncbi:diguanylate cyclase/phosphodiesterase with PAS/PAC sensor(s) [Gloeocapsa sp. PCC 7428]|uniref:EAL domain-containing protein n=1 Tax=Gloeocapsa sp. PCC 7428 TaxID=1173026 RepID=UPI0002A614F2|nr:EAL domain-containing protein [Gloeocapsa sp. PCC 7428]AFZ31054.1 diguanylate cyclase/phosphodiesterase with PAS/PAC sensor(s) [Gloeocapsa sp. PCC 7428]
MKIKQKLICAFLGTSFLLGVTSSISLVNNLRVRYNINQVTESSLEEFTNSNELSVVLQQTQAKLREFIEEKHRINHHLEKPTATQTQITNLKKTVLQDLSKVNDYIDLSKQATKHGIQLAILDGKKRLDEEKELEDLEEIKSKFLTHENNIIHLFNLINQDSELATVFFKKELEPHFEATLIPLIVEYNHDARGEVLAEVQQVQGAINRANTLILFSTALAFSSAIGLGSFISRSIAKPLIKLTQAANKVSEGETSTRVNIKNQDEIGILAAAFNQMLDDLNTTMVSKSYLDSIIEFMADALIVLDTNLVILRVNLATAKILETCPDKIIGKSIKALFPPEEKLEELSIQEILNRGKIEILATYWLTNTGKQKPVSFSATAMYNQQGKLQGIVCVAQDIAERKQSQERLTKINECFLNFGTEPTANINRLTALCGELLGAVGASYYRLEKAKACLVGQWQIASEDKLEVNSPESVFEQLIQQCCEDRYAGHDSQNSQEANIYLKILTKKTKTYICQAVKCKETIVGALCAYQQNLTLTEADKKIIGIITAAIGVEEQRREIQEALRDSEERYALATRGTNDGLWDWDLNTNEVYFSPRWKSMLGYQEKEIGNTVEDWFNLVHLQDIDQLKAAIASHLQAQTPQLETEYRILHKDGAYRWMLSRGLAVRDRDGKPYRLAGSQADITASKAAETELLHQVFHDALTGLPNRLLFTEQLEQSIERVRQQENYSFAVLFLDLDRFKVVNDSLGHLIGDQLLIAIARRLKMCVRPEDIVARLGGDEFTILLENIRKVEDATQIAERIQNALALPFNFEGHEVFTSASIGIAFSTTGYEKPEDLLRDADTTMYRAKGLGKARYAVFDTSMHAQAVALLQMETYLRHAVERQEFQLHYQPIVNLKTRELVGFEALIRLWHAERGFISPAEFIPVAEETGLIIQIGTWVLREACRQMYEWQHKFTAARDLKISVNISPKQFRQLDLVTQVEQILREIGLNARDLKLEITESTLVENADLVASMLKEMQALGIGLSIDDFGTGYSSLSYLHRFAIDTLKIDKSFIKDFNTDWEKSKIVNTVIVLAENLGIDVIAEGVETAEQAYLLQELKCDFGQGFLFSRPLDAQATEALIAAKLECMWV